MPAARDGRGPAVKRLRAKPQAALPTFTIHYPPSTIHHPLSTIHYPPSTIHYPLSTIHYPLSTIHYPLSTIHYRPPPGARTAHSQPAEVATYSVPLAATGEASTLAPRLMRLRTFSSLPAESTQRAFEVGM